MPCPHVLPLVFAPPVRTLREEELKTLQPRSALSQLQVVPHTSHYLEEGEGQVRVEVGGARSEKRWEEPGQKRGGRNRERKRCVVCVGMVRGRSRGDEEVGGAMGGV